MSADRNIQETTATQLSVEERDLFVSKRNDGESALHHALREILLVEAGRSIRHNMTDAEMWQRMTDIARAALEGDRG